MRNRKTGLVSEVLRDRVRPMPNMSRPDLGLDIMQQIGIDTRKENEIRMMKIVRI